MDGNRFDDVGSQSVSSAVINSDPLAIRGVFSNGDDTFSCLFCNLGSMPFKNVSMHVVRKQHCIKVDKLQSNCKIVGKHITCNLCKHYVATDWKAFINHFNEKKHFDELKDKKIDSTESNSLDSKVSYLTLGTNQMIELEPGVFYCCCCKKTINGWNLVLKHTVSEEHKKLRKTLTGNQSAPKGAENNCRKWAINGIFCISFTRFHCHLCECQLSGPRSWIEHIQGYGHTDNMMKRKSISRQPSPQNFETDKNPQNLTPKVVWDETSESFKQLLRDNSITGPSRRGNWICRLCDCRLSGPKTVSEHISGNSHKTLLHQATKTDETSENSSTSWETENSSESWETYEGESQSYDSYDANSSYSWQSSVNVLDSWETISTENSSSGSGGSTLFEVPEDLIPLISKHCLEHRKKELFCTLCKAHLQSPQSIVDHTNSRYHIAELKGHNAKVDAQKKKPSATLPKSRAENSPVNSIDNKPAKAHTNKEAPLLQQDAAKKPESSQPKLMEIPKHLIPLISKHLLQHKEKLIYCVACNVQLQSYQSLVAHTKSKYHVQELEYYRAKLEKKNKISQSTSAATSRSSSVSNAASKMKLAVSADTVINKSEPSQPRFFTIPKYLLPILESHSMQHLGHEVLCLPCQVRLQHLSPLFEHINGKKHIAAFSKYKAEVLNKGKSSETTSKTTATANPPPINAVDERASSSNSDDNATSSKTSTTDPKNVQPILMDIPQRLVHLVEQHSLIHLENEIYCPACQVHLKHATSLVSHTKSRGHDIQLKLFRKNCSNKNVNPKNVQPILMNIPQRLVHLIEEHSLIHLENEIYCPACQVRLKHATSLLSHTKSRGHDIQLKLFRKGCSDKNVEAKTTSQAQRSETPVANTILQAQRSETPVTNTSLQAQRSETPVAETESNPTRITSGADTLANLERILSELEIKNPKDSKRSKGRPPRQSRSGKQETRPKKGRSFDPKYLKVDMQHIYEINPEKLRIMELSCQLCFPKSSNAIYCLICERSEAGGFQSFYEHICSTGHTIYLAEAEQNDKLFINYPNQFSDLKLAKEYMQQTPKDTIQCLACDASMKNDDIVILEHVNEDSHKERKQVWSREMNKIYQHILVQNKSTWYNIYKYWCDLCYLEFNTEFTFAEHMDGKRHKKWQQKSKGKLVYDSCISCATVLLGHTRVFTEHCEQPMHKYLLRHGDFLVCKLPEQAITLLKNADAEVQKLIELSDQVSTVQKAKADSLLQCLEHSVSPLFPNAKAYPFGSRVSGLGFPDSDIDVFLDCGVYEEDTGIDGFQSKLIVFVERCLIRNQQSWEIEETLATSRTPIIKLRHRDTELSCDVSFKNGLSVENTKLLKCFIDTYPLCRKLMLFIKKWLSSCSLSGSQYITNYAMCWWIIFYLQSKSILPSIASMIAKKNESKIIDGWETGISETFDIGGEEFTFVDLLHDFFVFCTNFDYRYSVACPLLANTVQKEDFTELHRLPKEMAPYVNNITAKTVNGPVELFRIDSEMCIQDPYDLSHNLTKAVRKFTLNRFKRLCASSAEFLNNLKQL